MSKPEHGSESEPQPDSLPATHQTIEDVARRTAEIAIDSRVVEALIDRGTVLNWDRYGSFSYVIVDPEAPAAIRNSVIVFTLEHSEETAAISDCTVTELSRSAQVRRRLGKVVEPEVVSAGQPRLLSESEAVELIGYLKTAPSSGTLERDRE